MGPRLTRWRTGWIVPSQAPVVLGKRGLRETPSFQPSAALLGIWDLGFPLLCPVATNQELCGVCPQCLPAVTTFAQVLTLFPRSTVTCLPGSRSIHRASGTVGNWAPQRASTHIREIRPLRHVLTNPRQLVH